MNKYIVHIGPDTLAIAAKNRKNISAAIKRAMRGRKPRNGEKPYAGDRSSLCYTYKGRKYNYIELEEAEIMTLNEYWKALRG